MSGLGDYGQPVPGYLKDRVAEKMISKPDADLIQEYCNYLVSKKGLAENSINNTARYLVKIINHIPNVKKWTGPRIDEYMAFSRSNFKANTIRKDVFNLRSFCKWLADKKVIGQNVCKEIQEVEAPAADRMTKTAGEMLSSDEVMRIITATKNSRDRAILSVLFESAMRPIEILDLTWGQVKQDDKGAVINTSKKTGRARYIRLIHSAGHLAAWQNDYPLKITPDAYVFLSLKKKPYERLSRAGLRKIISKWSAAAGMEKRVYAYLFRHSRVTDMLAKNVPDSVIKTQCWGSLATPMLATYGHLNNDQLDDLLMQAEGVQPKKSIEPSSMKETECPRCGVKNPSGIEYCGKCGAILDPVKYQESIALQSDADKMAAKIEQLEKTLATVTKILEIKEARDSQRV